MKLKAIFFATSFAFAAALASSAAAGVGIGNFGTLGPNGVVTAPPGGSNYDYVSTYGGVGGAGQIGSVGGTNGSQYTSDAFAGTNGDALSFYFNYVTSDGAGYADYGFAELLNGSNSHIAWLFTARTTTSGNTSPGFGLPSNDSVLTPASNPIIGGTTWSVLGGSSGGCWSTGCGHTGWIKSTYTIGAADTYKVRYGTTNWGDTSYDSGLAYVGLALNGGSVGGGTGTSVPEPMTWALMIMGFGGIGAMLRSRRLVPA